MGQLMFCRIGQCSRSLSLVKWQSQNLSNVTHISYAWTTFQPTRDYALTTVQNPECVGAFRPEYVGAMSMNRGCLITQLAVGGVWRPLTSQAMLRD
jgi:hypothetical protein